MLITEKCGELEYLRSDNIAVSHGFTTRFGGVSQGHLASLNLGLSRGDAYENVVENYRRLGAALGFDPHRCVLSRQVHSDIVYAAGKSDWGRGLFCEHLPDCDALVTNTPGTALVVFTADCTPVLLWDEKTGAVGAAHAGWRGTASGIAARTVEAMVKHYGAEPQNIHAAIGPNIGLCHFETHGDVPQALISAFGEEMQEYIVPQGEKYRVDLKAVNAWVLRQAGVSDIRLADECTVCQSSRFWSYRVTGSARGSQAGVIVCGEAGL